MTRLKNLMATVVLKVYETMKPSKLRKGYETVVKIHNALKTHYYLRENDCINGNILVFLTGNSNTMKILMALGYSIVARYSTRLINER